MELPRKSLGQHWLSDVETLKAIVELAAINPDETVLEIGPGQGTLTKYLCERARQVVAVELDGTLAAQLTRRVASKKLKVIHGDILKFDLAGLPAGYKVVANIPYYLTSNLLRTLSESPNPPKRLVLLVQKEVAERVCARPGQMSLLSVSVQLYYECRLGLLVPAEKFDPPPKVDSQVIILHRYPQPLYKKLDKRLFFQVVKAGFSERRKKLRSSLAAGLHLSKEQVDDLLLKAEVNAELRAQALSLEQWYRIYLELAAQRSLRSLL